MILVQKSTRAVYILFCPALQAVSRTVAVYTSAACYLGSGGGVLVLL